MFKKLIKFIFKKEFETMKHNEFEKYSLIMDNVYVIRNLLLVLKENTWDKEKVDEIYDRVNHIEQTLNEICLDNNRLV